MRNVKPVKVGDCILDGKHIYIQSMLNARSDDIDGSIKQAKELEAAGCEIIRAAIPDMDAVKLIPAIKEAVDIPLVADIHFDYKLALESAAAGVDKIRINPGNIGGMDRVKKVVDVCRSRNIPIRIGVNSGSLEKGILAKYGSPTPEALVESAMGHAAMLEHFDFSDIVISIKSSDVGRMIASYRLAAEKCPYPLHLGVTEAGTERMGLIKSAVGIGSLLCDGIGETIRVSLTDDPVKEIEAAKDILKSIGKRGGVKIVSCPTCGRTRIDLVKAAKMVEEAVKDMDKDITVAVMGCIVNGPGEAKEADVGIAGGNGCAVIFKKDGTQRKIKEEDIVSELLAEIDKL
ncbi:MAG: flavodoxin-dependent (E)-4-hydroxy-3-methylbut-2-enyl-diphosphate synthase [Ruminococcus flavefaciens]|nr:flavodoxin-dependent (E)-4-hydroxy-3-methylbut-2-enyl-diphosphate synthase [Ruminococcus flavefaciens]MCM1361733.1 flavodoxin-dependent (E)-4-hydroxy-3-methylbut-2-enyl-diphosphate synthase [Clostridiales bacterium]MCM1436072.1 flavodoxin-dependent (E)-4-hydroxy-3-methylbut-2-enyl-diphosphate synthase [Ruminococcus flavefaciens]